MTYANKSVFFWNFRNIQTATLIRKRIISALIDKARNSTAGKQPRSGKETHPHWTRTGRGGEYSPDGTREEKPERNEGTSG